MSNQVNLPFKFFIYGLIICLSTNVLIGQEETHIRKKAEIKGGIAPKSVVISPKGIVAAQNMMYRHSVTIYSEDGHLIHKIKDDVNLHDYGLNQYKNESIKGAPVEGAFTSDGKYLWVSNYSMEGTDFENKGCDDCVGKAYDPGFLYKINIASGLIENVIEVGSVPKHLAISDNDSLLIVSNWVSSDVSIIDLSKEKEINRIEVGPHPRGIVIDKNSSKAFVAIMGSSKIAVIDLEKDSLSYLKNVGKAPRSLALDSSDSLLYISLNSESKVVKYNLNTEEQTHCQTASGPRSMTLSPDGLFLYVVNYFDDQFTKIETTHMTQVASIPTAAKPIGICSNWEKGEIWVACYSGKIEIYRDFKIVPPVNESWLTYGLSFIPTADTSRQFIAPENSNTLRKNNPTYTILDGKRSLKLEPIAHESEKKSMNCGYYIIIGAFSISENANSKKLELVNRGYNASVINGKYNYVSVSCATTQEEAELEKYRIQTSNPDWKSAWILKI